ncbi:MAG TPA: urease accessory protein UreD [Solirubrobacteraceae bacterium]|nr:urease accessory protein UreD [Solirubrobacteraceae bacterium]
MHAAFVPTQAGPLAGDRDSARIVVGAGATLVVEPVAATLALPGAACTVLSLDVTVREGGRLVLDEGPLIVCAGAQVRRRCTIELEAGAVAALRETFVLGRDGEPAGTLDAATRVTLDARPLLHDAARLGPTTRRDDVHVALAPGHRVVSTICLLGVRPPETGAPGAPDAPDEDVLRLHGPGALLRATGTSAAATDAIADATWRAWSRTALDPRPAPPSAQPAGSA